MTPFYNCIYLVARGDTFNSSLFWIGYMEKDSNRGAYISYSYCLADVIDCLLIRF